jgi:endonuclease/exonuclease/phosphatase family metal-dependent hydrolase
MLSLGYKTVTNFGGENELLLPHGLDFVVGGCDGLPNEFTLLGPEGSGDRIRCLCVSPKEDGPTKPNYAEETIKFRAKSKVISKTQRKIPSQLTKLKIISLNVHGYATTQDSDPNIISQSILGRLGALDPPADVICLQEDLSAIQRNRFDDYILVSTCTAEASGDTYLMNSIYIHETLVGLIHDISKNFTEWDITAGCTVPRCAAAINLGGLQIANVHLCGGWIDDQKFKDLVNVRGESLRGLINSLQPEIIVGDFNAESTTQGALITLSHYPLYVNLPEKTKGSF